VSSPSEVPGALPTVACGRGFKAEADTSRPVTADGTPDGTATPDAVRATLRALALGEPPDSGGPTDPEALVEEAEAALSGVDAAAGFADGGGFERLRSVASGGAAAGADADPDGAVVARAATVLDALSRYRDAYRAVVDAGADPVDRDGGDSTTRDDAADHFHSAHDSPIPDRAERRDDR